MSTTLETPRNSVAGMAAFFVGAAALLIILVHHFGGPFNPQQEIGITIGEIAGDIKNAAIAKVTGTPLPTAEPKPEFIDYDRILRIVGAAGGALAVILGLFGLIRHEDRKPAVYAVGLGIGAIAFQWVSWVVMLICGLVLLISILNSMTSIFDGFGGFFDGFG